MYRPFVLAACVAAFLGVGVPSAHAGLSQPNKTGTLDDGATAVLLDNNGFAKVTLQCDLGGSDLVVKNREGKTLRVWVDGGTFTVDPGDAKGATVHEVEVVQISDLSQKFATLVLSVSDTTGKCDFVSQATVRLP